MNHLTRVLEDMTNVGISLGSPPSAIRHWFSREAIPHLDRNLRLRLAAMASDLHGVRVDARENLVCSFNLPPSAVPQAAPPTIGLGLPLALSAMMWMVLVHHLSSCPAHINARASYVCTTLLGVQPPRRVEHAADNPGPHSLCRARLRTAPTTLLAMPLSFARSFCVLGISAQPVRRL